MNYQQILYDVDERTLLLTLHRPEKLNAFTETMLDELIDALHRADEDDEIRAIIVTGAGRAFCAGADLSRGAATFDYQRRDPAGADPETHRDGGGRLSLEVFNLKKPIIAAINGPAVGVGVTMTLPMDVRLASTKARVGFVFSRRGVVPEACSTYFLPRIVGISQAAEWIYSGRVFDAGEALAGRLVSRVLPPEDLLPTARRLAREIAENTSAVSVALCRQMLWRTLSAAHPMEAHRIESKGIFWTGQSADAAEGIQSFLEKRPPRFTLKPSTDLPPYYPWWQEPEF